MKVPARRPARESKAPTGSAAGAPPASLLCVLSVDEGLIRLIHSDFNPVASGAADDQNPSLSPQGAQEEGYVPDADKYLNAFLEAAGVAVGKRVDLAARIKRMAARAKDTLPLPDKAPERYDARPVKPELGRKEKIGEFMLRVWGKYMDPDAGPLTRKLLRDVDDSAAVGIENWLSYHKALPQGVFLPTLTEAFEADLESELKNADPRKLLSIGRAAYRRGLVK